MTIVRQVAGMLLSLLIVAVALLALGTLGGCQTFGGYNQMTPEQISAAVKDKNAFCLTLVSNAGVAKLVVVDLTKSSEVAVNAETCNVVVTSHDTPPKTSPPSVPPAAQPKVTP